MCSRCRICLKVGHLGPLQMPVSILEVALLTMALFERPSLSSVMHPSTHLVRYLCQYSSTKTLTSFLGGCARVGQASGLCSLPFQSHEEAVKLTSSLPVPAL